jgi:hypothetical protein
MIDNIEIIKGLLKFDSNDDFYYVQILQRKKENRELGSNSRVIKNYYIKSEEHLDKVYGEIRQLCDVFNARAMFRLNKRSFYKTAFKAMVNTANTMANNDFLNIRSQYDKACGQGHNDKTKKWILDIDEVGRNCNDMIVFIERKCEPIGVKFVAIIPSKNGLHLITTPFNLMEFKKIYPEIEIHKDNPTNLYIP